MSDMLSKMPLPFEPKKKNRWLLRFPSDVGIQEFSLMSAARPKYTAESIEIPFLNTKTYVQGSFKWEPIQVVLRDAIGPSTTQAVMEWIRLHSETATGRQGYAVGYKKNIEVEMLDPAGVCIEKWVLEGTWITNADFGDLDMSDDAIATITLDLQFDRAIHLY
jgi:hypothetical protein